MINLQHYPLMSILGCGYARSTKKNMQTLHFAIPVKEKFKYTSWYEKQTCEHCMAITIAQLTGKHLALRNKTIVHELVLGCLFSFPFKVPFEDMSHINACEELKLV